MSILCRGNYTTRRNERGFLIRSFFFSRRLFMRGSPVRFFFLNYFFSYFIGRRITIGRDVLSIYPRYIILFLSFFVFFFFFAACSIDQKIIAPIENSRAGGFLVVFFFQISSTYILMKKKKKNTKLFPREFILPDPPPPARSKLNWDILSPVRAFDPSP